MKTIKLIILFITIPFQIILSQTGKVVDVIDGDTVTIKLTEYSSRRNFDIAFIDAPEISQEFGMKSKQHLVNILMNKQISFSVLENENKKRNFGKKSNKKIILYYSNGEDLSNHLLTNGYAWFNLESEVSSERKKEFLNIQKKAKRKKIGLWGGSNIQYPKDFVFLENEKDKNKVLNSKQNSSYSGIH